MHGTTVKKKKDVKLLFETKETWVVGSIWGLPMHYLLQIIFIPFREKVTLKKLNAIVVDVIILLYLLYNEISNTVAVKLQGCSAAT